MTQATVDNNPVSIALGNGESTTVPTGEVWRVTITAASDGNYFSELFIRVKVNGEPLATYSHVSSNSMGGGAGQTVETVLVGGDTVSVEENTNNGTNVGGAHIGGFVVN